jgi:hypothetical protein
VRNSSSTVFLQFKHNINNTEYFFGLVYNPHIDYFVGQIPLQQVGTVEFYVTSSYSGLTQSSTLNTYQVYAIDTPDLTILQPLVVNEYPDFIEVEVTIENIGRGHAESFNVILLAETLTSSDDIEQMRLNPLQGGEYITIHLHWDPKPGEGTYTLNVVVDASYEVNEGNENNNQGEPYTLSISPPSSDITDEGDDLILYVISLPILIILILILALWVKSKKKVTINDEEDDWL